MAAQRWCRTARAWPPPHQCKAGLTRRWLDKTRRPFARSPAPGRSPRTRGQLGWDRNRPFNAHLADLFARLRYAPPRGSFHLDGDRVLHRFAARTEIDWLISAAFQVGYEVFNGAHLTLEARGAESNQAHEMTVRTANLAVAEALSQLLAALILAFARAAVVNLHGDDMLQRWLF